MVHLIISIICSRVAFAIKSATLHISFLAFICGHSILSWNDMEHFVGGLALFYIVVRLFHVFKMQQINCFIWTFGNLLPLKLYGLEAESGDAKYIQSYSQN